VFGVGFFEIVVIVALALMLFGPDELPNIVRTIGKAMGQMRRQTDAVKREFYSAVYPAAQEVKRELDTERRQLRSIKDELLAPPSLVDPPRPTSEAPAPAPTDTSSDKPS
jgi:sec-independent protein translocase protein TatB